jgi:hypothetical protein
MILLLICILEVSKFESQLEQRLPRVMFFFVAVPSEKFRDCAINKAPISIF